MAGTGLVSPSYDDSDGGVMSRVGQVLRQLLPQGVYDTSPSSLVSQDIEAHATAFAGVLNADRALLGAIAAIPTWLVPEYEAEYGLPGKCLAGSSFVAALTMPQRIALIQQSQNRQAWYTPSGISALMAKVNVTVVQIERFTPATCMKPCTQLLNTPLSRFRLNLYLTGATAEAQSIIPCLIANDLPQALEIRVFYQ